MKRYIVVFISINFFFVFLFAGCGSSDIVKNISAEERFDIGKQKFDKEDYLEAMNEFEIIKLQFPGSAVADDAQYYLAECRFKREEFLIAAEEYQNLRRNMPASSLVPLAQYKIGLCYYNLSPKSSLDQKYTLRAIDELQTFIEYNPKHELVSDADSKIKELNTRLAKKLFDAAELYMKMEYYKSATIYYTNVIQKYHDTPYAEEAFLGKVKSLIARNKYGEAKTVIETFIDKYPNSQKKSEAESLRTDINERLKNNSASTGL